MSHLLLKIQRSFSCVMILIRKMKKNSYKIDQVLETNNNTTRKHGGT